MQLKGKAKKAFEKWYIKTECKDLKTLGQIRTEMKMFYNVLTPSMQYGVYVDFADSVGVYISVTNYEARYTGIVFVWETKYLNKFTSRFKDKASTRPEARIAAIEKFDQILNERL